MKLIQMFAPLIMMTLVPVAFAFEEEGGGCTQPNIAQVRQSCGQLTSHYSCSICCMQNTSGYGEACFQACKAGCPPAQPGDPEDPEAMLLRPTGQQLCQK